MRRRSELFEADTTRERWFVSYSDLLTLLFAVFVVLFASAYRDHVSIQRVSKSVQHGLNQMGAFSGSEPAADPTVAAPDPATAKAPAPSAPPPPNDASQLKHRLEEILTPEINRQEVVMSESREGFVISLREAGSFNSGQARLLPRAADTVERIAAPLIDSDLSIRVEGHSDNVPIHNARFKSNWDLSTARAMAVGRQLMRKPGLDPSRVSIAGYGEYKPIASNQTPEGRRANRRVDIVVLSARPSPGATVR